MWWSKPKNSSELVSETLGQQGERLAAEYYLSLGYKILERNEFNRKGKRLGEIDFVAEKQGRIFFVEVKTRSKEKSRFGTPLDSINFVKQRKLIVAVKSYFLRHKILAGRPHQIDACIVILPFLDNPPQSVTIYSNVVEDWN